MGNGFMWSEILCLLLASDTPASVWMGGSVLWTEGESRRATHRSTLLLAFALINASEANFFYFFASHPTTGQCQRRRHIKSSELRLKKASSDTSTHTLTFE